MIIITIIINNDDNSNNWLYMCADSETAAERISVPASRIFCSPSTSRSVMAVAFELVGDGDGTGEAILMRINDARTASSLHRRRWRTLALPRPPSSSTLFNRDDDNADLHSRRPPDRRTSVVRVRLPDNRSSLSIAHSNLLRRMRATAPFVDWYRRRRESVPGDCDRSMTWTVGTRPIMHA